MSADTTRDALKTAERPPTGAVPRGPSGTTTRLHILAAAAELAKEKGAAHVSIEDIARRAGISKGGVLYHFPRKDALIRALVEQHLADVETELANVEATNRHRRTNAVARTFVQVHREKDCRYGAKFDGVLLALAENPHLLEPIRTHEARVVERIRKTAADPELSLIAMLVIMGIRTLYLFEMDEILSNKERMAVVERLLGMLADDQERGGQGRTA
jgi:AcrR family transcriptional regulator